MFSVYETLDQACIGMNILFSKIGQAFLIKIILESTDHHVDEPRKSDITLYLTNTLLFEIIFSFFLIDSALVQFYFIKLVCVLCFLDARYTFSPPPMSHLTDRGDKYGARYGSAGDVSTGARVGF